MRNTINHIRDYETGIEFTSDELLSKYYNDPREKSKVRRELYKATKNDEKKQLVCSICNEALKLCGGINTKQKLHFRHYQDNKDCPIKTSENKNQKEIDTIRYNGAKESKRHLELKNFIYNCLVKDERFKEPAMERVVKILNDKKSWRRPDISAIFKDKKIVFEVQLQTTYLNVIVEREEDYKFEKTYIMWFFDSTNMEKFRFSEEDIFYANKSNAFIITNETMKLSLEKNKFLFECCYKQPYLNDNLIEEKWESNVISFDDLNFDNINYKVYYYDFDKEVKKLQEKVKIEKKNNKLIELNFEKDIIKKSFIKLAQCNMNSYKIFEDNLKPLLVKFNVLNNSKIIRTIFILHSIREKKVYGWKNKSLIWALNNFFHHNKEYTFLIISMITKSNLWDFILKEDRNDSFKNKVNNWKLRDKNIDNKKYNALFVSLFPELTSENRNK